jgi:hypothetical protein
MEGQEMQSETASNALGRQRAEGEEGLPHSGAVPADPTPLPLPSSVVPLPPPPFLQILADGSLKAVALVVHAVRHRF